MANLVGEYGPHFLRPHGAQKPRGDGHEGLISVPARGKGVGLLRGENAHFGHANACLPGELGDRIEQPLLFPIARLGKDLRARALLRHELAEQKGYEGAAHAEDAAEGKERAHVEVDAVGREDAAHPKQVQGDPSQHHHG